MPPNVPNKLGPTTFAEVKEFAETISQSDFCPKDYKGKPGNIIVAIQLGAEVGLAPLQSLQNIAVINGRPSIWGDAMLALVKASGLLGDFDEPYDEKRQEYKCISVRKDNKNKAVTTFSMDDAKRARLAGKQGPWSEYPKRMLQMRARGFNLRDNFPDVLKGLISREEAQDYPVDVTATPAPAVGIEDHHARDVVIVPEDPDLCAHMSNPDTCEDPECVARRASTLQAMNPNSGGVNEELAEASAARVASPPNSSPKATGGPPTLTSDEQDAIYQLIDELANKHGIASTPDLEAILKTQFVVSELRDVPRKHFEALKRRLNIEAQRVSA